MPVKSSSSSVLKWPNAADVRAAAREWARREQRARPQLVRLGFFGSYARGDAGVGSDLDLVAVVREADQPFERRAAAWDLTTLPVPADLLVYAEPEWQRLTETESKFARMLKNEVVWLVGS